VISWIGKKSPIDTCTSHIKGSMKVCLIGSIFH